MLRDFHSEFSADAAQGADVCICGAGVAGITLALKLAERGYRVLLLEGGGLQYTDESQTLYEAEAPGIPCYPRFTRLRFFGGTSNHWSGRCKPFSELDFARHSIAGLPGWPIAKSEIDPYLAEAAHILDLPGENAFSALPGPKLDRALLEPDRFAMSAPTRFGSKYLDVVRGSGRLIAYVNANVTEIVLDDSLRSVDFVSVRSIGQEPAVIRARIFVLAMGAIENARLLLVSNRQIAAGIGNEGGYVGRCFMEHFNVSMGAFTLASRYQNLKSQIQYITSSDYASQSEIGLSNLTLSFVQGYKAWGRTAKLKEALQRFACETGTEGAARFLMEFNCPGEGVITSLCEQSPNPDSRVALSPQRDRLGMQRAIVDWRMNDFDRRSIRASAMTLAKQFARHDVGRVKLHDYILQDDKAIPAVHHSHHMGTTRMAKSVKDGVTSVDCGVFGVDNLYVAGSSIFSTGGGNNPTLPIVQFTLRLADKLASTLASSAVRGQ